MSGQLIWVSTPHNAATFGIVVNADDIVVEAAPIGRWMIGKTFDEVEEWVFSKQGVIWPQGRER